MDDRIEKALADTTLRKRKLERVYSSSGIRELDEMLGGGFRKGTLTLLQQDLGSGGEMILSKIIELQLSLSNVVLVILSDPTAIFLEDKLKVFESGELNTNLIVLNLVQLSKENVNIVFDKHEISLRIREIRKKASDLLEKQRKIDEEIELFTFFVSLNPFVLNLSQDKVLRMLYDNLLQCVEYGSIDLMLLNKGIHSIEMNARIQSLFHNVIDLRSFFEGVQKKNELRILKMVGRYYDVKIEPYVISFDEKLNKFNFVIKSAFLTSFETFRNLLNWNNGSISLSREPYILAPVSYLNNLLDMPINIDKKKGKDEIIEKAQGIGRRMTIMVENLYYVKNIDLFKVTLQTASLLGWGDAELVAYEPEENLITLNHKIHDEFNENTYLAFLEGYYRGAIKRSLNRGIRYVKTSREDITKIGVKEKIIKTYSIKIRLSRIEDNKIDEYT